MANSAKALIKKILIGIFTATIILPSFALAARTTVDWVNPSGTTYIQPNFGINGMDILIYGSNRYENFNTVTGTNGYGLRDNAGTMEFKNSGGSWQGIGTGGSSGVTAVNGTTNQITSSGGTTPTLSLPNLVIFPSAASSTLLSVLNTFYVGGTATTTINSLGNLSTNQATSTSFYDTSMTSALALFDANHKETQYGGASACSSNNFVTTISAVGGTTCGTAQISGVNLGSNLNNLTINNGGSGAASGSTYNGSAAVTLSYNSIGAVPTGTTITVAGTANQITSSAGAQDLSANRTWTLSFPSLIIQPNASTTVFSNFGTAYFGGTSTTTISTTGAITAPSGVLNTFPNASTTNLTAGTSFQVPNSSNPSPTVTGYITQSTNAPYQIHTGGNGATTVFDPRPAFILTVSSTTALTGTTTSPVFVFPVGMTVTNWMCTVQPGGATAEVAFQYANPTAYTTVAPTYLAASTTPGIITISSNNTPTAQATSTLSVGNVTGSPTSASCSFYGNSTAI